MTHPDLAQIAARLTEDEARELLWHDCKTYRNPRLKWMLAGHHLVNAGLAQFNPNKRVSSIRLTSTGYEVAEYLRSQAHG